jgi:Ca2+:H+ antiporter
LILLPAAVALRAAGGSELAIFLTSAAAIVPVAAWMGRATEHLAERLGEGIGGLLNATFGNAAELIIAGMALWAAAQAKEAGDLEAMARMHDLVKASLTGSIIGNVLLVLGLALLVGGLRHKVQTFNATANRAGATLMMLAVVALLIPDLYAYVFSSPDKAPISSLSLELSFVLLVIYALSLLFTLHTHKHLYVSGVGTADLEGKAGREGVWSVKKALGVLAIATAGVAVLAELMIHSVSEAAHSIHLSEIFVGVIVVAIVGNAAEHSTAVLVAWHNRMDLSLSVAIGSSIQIALFVAPLLVLVSYLFGAPLNLLFLPAEIVAMVVSVLVVAQIAGDGESNWLEGVLLICLYIMLAIVFYHMPSGRVG